METHNQNKPDWMAHHEADDERRFSSIDDALRRIEAKLDPDSDKYLLGPMEAKIEPVSEAYRTATTLGKWLMGGAVFLSVLLGIVLSLRTFFTK